jgi:hypothetical protein
LGELTARAINSKRPYPSPLLKLPEPRARSYPLPPRAASCRIPRGAAARCPTRATPVCRNRLKRGSLVSRASMLASSEVSGVVASRAAPEDGVAAAAKVMRQLGDARPPISPAGVVGRLQALAKSLPPGERLVLKVSERCYHSTEGTREIVCTAKHGAQPLHVPDMRFYGRDLEAVLTEAFGVERADTGERLFTRRLYVMYSRSDDADPWVEGASATAFWLGNTFTSDDETDEADQHARIMAHPAYEVTANGAIYHRRGRLDAGE